MWILYGIPSAYHFLKARGSYDRYFTCLHWPWQRRLLDQMGLAADDLVEHKLERTYCCDRMSLIRHQFRNFVVSESDRLIFQSVAQTFEKNRQREYGERIFIARNLQGDSHYGRRLVNERELAQKLIALGFTVVQPETLAFPEQVRAFSGARVIVGLGGAGMFNAVFARPGTRIVAIESSMNWVNSHVNLFGSCGLKCGVIIGKQDLNDSEPVHKRWLIDVEVAVRRIDAFAS